MGASRTSYDVVIVGGGHNALTAANYLGRAGLAVLVLERLDHVGGAAVNAQPFPGLPARLSRYSYLVSLLPESIVRELDLHLELRSRSTASYSPTIRDGRHLGLYVEHEESADTRRSFRELTGTDEEYAAWRELHADIAAVAAQVAPSLTRPLVTAREMASGLDPAVWAGLVERPLGELIEARLSDDLVRGVVATDALIGTFAGLHDPSLVQNRCFLYHQIGNGTGEWKVPVGGMGAVTDALAAGAVAAGAEILTGAGVSSIVASPDGAEVSWHDGTRQHSVAARQVLSGVAPWVLKILMGAEHDRGKPQGAQLKVNFLLSRLPKLCSGHDPAEAFAGTLHIGEEYAALDTAFREAASGQLPTSPPGEFYCHSLTDPSILGPMADQGVHALTYFGLHLPESLFASSPEEQKAEAVRRAIAAVDVHLAEPLIDCVLRAPDGSPCVEAKIPQDIESDLAMPGGHIFHGDLAWPWAGNHEVLDTPAQRWGVATDVDSVLLCGSGARRGGAVSGLGGHNAARAVLESR